MTAQPTADRTRRRAVYIVAPTTESADQERIRSALVANFSDDQIDLVVRRANKVTVRGSEPRERSHWRLAPTDAAEIYQQAHVKDVLVFGTAAIWVQFDPSVTLPTKRTLLSLEDFLRYKCWYSLVRSVGEVAPAVGAAQWPPAGGCEDARDPRALPLHVFERSRPWPGLDLAETRRHFERSHHRRGGSRTDELRHRWEDAVDLHGAIGVDRAAPVVAGRELPIGTHWDVQRNRGKGSIVTVDAVWKLAHPRAYCNVDPTGHVRGNLAHGAKKVWP